MVSSPSTPPPEPPPAAVEARPGRARRARVEGVGLRRWLPAAMTREVLGWWLVTRVGLFLLSISAPLLFNRGTEYPDVWRAWVQWDVWHLKALAEFGYNNGEPSQAPLAAFFPGFPLLVHLVHFTGVGYFGAGIVVSAVASAVAGVYLARLAQYEFPELKGLGPNAAVVWYAAPVGVFLAAGYTEALFCAFAFPAWLAARQGRWARAAMFVALAATVRVSGIFLACALVVEFITSKKRDWPSAPWLMLPAIPVLGFMAYLKQIHGSWFAWQEAQEKGWAREFTWPWDSLIHTWDAASRGHFAGERSDWTWMFRAELVTLVIGLLLLAWLLWRRSWGEAAWIAATVGAFCTSFWIYSLTRATLLWWPLWIGLAVLVHRHRWLGRFYLCLAIPLAAIWAAGFFTGRWTG